MKYLPRLLAGALMLCASPVMAQVAPSSGAQRTGANVVLPDFRENLKAVPHLADNTALAAAATSAYPNGVWRDKFDNVRPARVLFFTPLTGTCTANSLVDDGFHCVNGAGGNSWAGQIPTTEIINVDDYGAIHDGSSHPLSNYFPTSAAAAAVCPSLNNLVGYTTAATTTSGSASITITGTYKPYVVPGQHITGTNIPASTYIGTINYSTGVATLVQSDRTTAQNATATGADTITAGFDVTWSSVEMDWCAIDAMIWAVRTSGGAASPYTRSGWLPAGSYVIKHPINLTCLSQPSGNTNCQNQANHQLAVFNFNGAYIDASGIASTDYSRVAIDMMGSRQILIRDVTIYGGGVCDGTEPLQRGIQMGRVLNAVTADVNLLSRVQVTGGFVQAPFYNLASEGSGTEYSLFRNCDTTNNAYNGIYDGGAHWQPTSDYTPVVMSTDVPQSMNDVWDRSSWFWNVSSGTGGGIWLYGSRRIRFDETYITATSAPCVTLYSGTAGGGDAASVAQMPIFNIHCEGTFANQFSIVSRSAAGAPIIYDLTFTDHFAFPTTNVFALGTNTTSVQLGGRTDIEIANSSSAAALFDSSSAWTVLNPRGITTHGSTITGTAPTISSCTGVGSTGTCTFGVIVTPNGGRIDMTPSGTGIAGTGTLTIAMPYKVGFSAMSCTASLQNSSGSWDTAATATLANGTNQSNLLIVWKNGATPTALTSASVYRVNYSCAGV